MATGWSSAILRATKLGLGKSPRQGQSFLMISKNLEGDEPLSEVPSSKIVCFVPATANLGHVVARKCLFQSYKAIIELLIMENEQFETEAWICHTPRAKHLTCDNNFSCLVNGDCLGPSSAV